MHDESGGPRSLRTLAGSAGLGWWGRRPGLHSPSRAPWRERVRASDANGGSASADHCHASGSAWVWRVRHAVHAWKRVPATIDPTDSDPG